MIFMIIIGMSIVTMIPRIIPAFIVDKLQFRDWVNRWLNAIPYAALGALIFPGILTVKPDQPEIGLIGAGVAVGLAYIGLNVILVVAGAILSIFIVSIYI
ncbi:AzlD domain-containing protein [Virgibacillus alimentarius]|uniref:Branched-subunit amino acid transport protein n=1 Tax=Virgibacillus alimentarius TaxID=698769 RepID=A0ABS4S8L8_9BACI|nr:MULTISPECIES: AzlD domain-containing protein [Virgibacillus]MBP2257843.1 branched-subunit amino acid transport protein [Virgibacillus alimentarius]HLR66567.1 AzlD domain-containing protein [Virgibacillus sp.]